MFIVLADGASIELEGVALVLECKSNLIFLGQLRDNKITYHNENTHMLLTQDGLLIAKVRRDQNLFVLDLAILRKIMQTNAMMTTRQGRPIHLVNRSKKVQVWHRRFGYANNARIIRASKILT